VVEARERKRDKSERNQLALQTALSGRLVENSRWLLSRCAALSAWPPPGPRSAFHYHFSLLFDKNAGAHVQLWCERRETGL
jgi:hypothetical protein